MVTTWTIGLLLTLTDTAPSMASGVCGSSVRVGQRVLAVLSI